MEYEICTGAERPDMFEIQAGIDWPEFILHDPVGERCWEGLFEKFPAYQFALLNDGEMVGCANSIPLSLNPDAIEYNDRGWDWALDKGFEDLASQKAPTVLCGLQIGINNKYKGKGISSLLIEGMRSIALDNQCKALILPIRPTLKHKYPLQDMADYICWTNKDGMPYDPWIRAHVKYGAEIVSVCEKAMYIPGTVAEWESWTGLSFQTSGKYIIQGALSPVVVSLEEDKVAYTEPNVWVVHQLDR